MSSPAQPLIDLRDKLSRFADKFNEWDKPTPSKKRADGKLPTAKELGWADQPQKLTAEGPKLGGKKKPAKKKAAAKQSARKSD